VEPRKGQRYSSELRRQAVERMNAYGNIVGLARELGVSRRVLYQWRDRLEQTDSSPGRSRWTSTVHQLCTNLTFS
jgi:transposase-like protein